MASKNPQCDKCLHKEVCRYIQQIEEIKAQYPFVSGISCAFLIKRSQAAATTTAEIQTAPSTETDSKENEKQELAQKESEAGQKEDGTEPDVLTIMDIEVSKIGLPDEKIIKILNKEGIYKVKDIYAHQEAHATNIRGLNRDMMKKLSDILTALSQPALRIV